MIDWYTDLIYEGKFRYLFNLLASALIIVVVSFLALAPDTMYASLLENNPVRVAYYDYFREFFYLTILSVIGVGFLFIGFDLMRDEIGFLGFIRIVCIGFGIMLSLLPQIVNATGIGITENMYAGRADAVTAMLRALPRFGFFYALTSGAYYAYVGISDDYGFFDDLSPVFPIVSSVISFLMSFGISLMVIK